jgi:Uncharacterized protein conserved in bacteria
MDGGDAIEISVLASIDEVTEAEWDACADPGADPGVRPSLNPFATHRFLKALEDSRSVGRGTGWQPRHLAARLGGRLVAAMPLYAKGHSQGEYVFDHAWAHAYERAGGEYYPKLQAAVPFTPATGPRLLVSPGIPREAGMAALIEGAVRFRLAGGGELAPRDVLRGGGMGGGRGGGAAGALEPAVHWENRGFEDFNASSPR